MANYYTSNSTNGTSAYKIDAQYWEVLVAEEKKKIEEEKKEKTKKEPVDPQPYYICPICQARFFNALAASIHQHLHSQAQRQERIDER